jgi:hypothetical protein
MTVGRMVARSCQTGDVALKSNGAAGVLSDTLALKRVCTGFMIMAAGAVKIVDEEDNACTIPTGAPAGTIFPIRVKQFYSTGTTVSAANLLLFYSKV